MHIYHYLIKSGIENKAIFDNSDQIDMVCI